MADIRAGLNVHEDGPEAESDVEMALLSQPQLRACHAFVDIHLR